MGVCDFTLTYNDGNTLSGNGFTKTTSHGVYKLSIA